MTKNLTIDVRGLDHAKKQEVIFPAVDGLNQGETLRIRFDFNPIPLVHMFKAQNRFDLAFEREGPDEWILQMTRTVPINDKKAQFKALLKDLRAGATTEETKAKAKELLGSVDATTLGLLEQELINEGVSHDEIRKSLCDVHLEVMRDSLVKQRIDVHAPHPIATLMEEHKIILQALHALDGIVKRFETYTRFDDLAGDRQALQEAAHLLVEAELHHDREEQCLFPMLEKHGVTEPPAIMKAEHVEFRAKKKELHKLVSTQGLYDFDTFKAKVIELGGFIASELESHIFKEDNILYQIALQVLTEDEWAEIKRGADEIGYCSFTPSLQNGPALT